MAEVVSLQVYKYLNECPHTGAEGMVDKAIFKRRFLCRNKHVIPAMNEMKNPNLSYNRELIN